MNLNLIFQEPLFFLAYLIAIFYVLTVHEFSHALSAHLVGDNTAKDYGRLTFNPFAHVDFLGLLMLFFAGFGWGKPVPINPNNFRKPRRDIMFVSFAGPLSNFLSGIFFILVLKIVVTYTTLSSANLLVNFLFILIIINFTLFIFNLLPIPPLDGSKILFSILPSKFDNIKYLLNKYGIWFLFGLLLADNFLNLGIFRTIFNEFLSLVAVIID